MYTVTIERQSGVEIQHFETEQQARAVMWAAKSHPLTAMVTLRGANNFGLDSVPMQSMRGVQG